LQELQHCAVGQALSALKWVQIFVGAGCHWCGTIKIWQRIRSTHVFTDVMPWVQMFIGDGAKLVRDAFALANEKPPRIIFI